MPTVLQSDVHSVLTTEANAENASSIWSPVILPSWITISLNRLDEERKIQPFQIRICKSDLHTVSLIYSVTLVSFC